MKRILIVVTFLFSMIACEKTITEDVNEPFEAVSSIPRLNFKSVNETTIDHYGDLVFKIEYVDGDGNLGSPNADEKTLFVVDNRDTIISMFHVIPLNPEPGNSHLITGVLEVYLDNVIMLNDTSQTEETNFTIYLYDQSGNKSNEVNSPTITINR
jgi:hypothetical protein